MFSDNEDKMVALLEQIANNTGGNGPDQDITIEGRTADNRVGLIPKNSYRVLETADLDSSKYPVTSGGTVTLNPGDEVPVAEFDLKMAAAIYAVGATDEQDVQYSLQVDGDRVVGGRTESPLGLLNDPFSFVEVLGGAVPVDNTARYMAHYDSSASGTIELAGRLHLEVMG